MIPFQDYRVAELVTPLARRTLLEINQLAKERYGMNIVYRDTDYVFVSSFNDIEEHRNASSESFIIEESFTSHTNTFRF